MIVTNLRLLFPEKLLTFPDIKNRSQHVYRSLQNVFETHKKSHPFGRLHILKRFNYFTFTSSTSKTNQEFGGITPPAPLSP